MHKTNAISVETDATLYLCAMNIYNSYNKYINTQNLFN